ncbi:MAG: cobyrinate a,c-diamide synthase [Verrucomicrobia bacterium]|nr:cobyrinate a,c-diamide synthase [Verrucomicrobiota bacterium]
MNMPRLVVAGAQSGVGKTTLTLGLVALLRRRGLRVQTFKVGPDYLDPTYLALASGRTCYNLDGWMTNRPYVEELFQRACEGADIAVIEGVMGLFDGADSASLEGSTAQIAQWLDAPALLIVHAHGMARSLAALIHGYTNFDSSVRVAGVIANHCGSARHQRLLADSLKSSSLPPLMGAVKRGALPPLSSRHLGLVTADHRVLSQTVLDQLADALAPALSLDAILQTAQKTSRIARRACPVPAVVSCETTPDAFVKLGIARDDAFHFYYPDNLETLERAGCDLIPFSPLNDSSLPEGLDGLYFGGGYPEEHAAALAANQGMLAEIRRFAESDGLIYAECGGLMYLSQGIETLDGRRHGQAGLLPAWTRMGKARKSLGYVEITFNGDCLWGKRGEKLRGHEFHYSVLDDDPTKEDGWQAVYAIKTRNPEPGTRNPEPEGFQRNRILASYAHPHFASNPRSVQHFVRCLKNSPCSCSPAMP